MRTKILLGVVSLLLILAVITTGCTTNTNQQSSTPSPSVTVKASPSTSTVGNVTFRSYSNSTLGVRLDVPSGWNISDDSNSTDFEVDFNSPYGDIIALMKYPSTLSLDEITSRLNDYYQAENHTLISSEDTTLGGLLAHKWHYTWISKGRVYERITIMAPQDGKINAIMYYSDRANFQRYVSVVDRMAASYTFVNATT